MTFISKSNVLASRSLGAVEGLTQTPAQAYADYAARVVADGGEIIDPAACLAAFTAAINGGYFGGLAVAYSPRWGVKRTGSASPYTLQKVYNLRGNIDGTPLGTVQLNTSLQSYPVFTMTAGLASINFANILLSKSGKQGVVMVDPTFGTYSTQATFTAGALVWYYSVYLSRIFRDGVQVVASNPDYTPVASDAVAFYTDQVVGKGMLNLNGVDRKSASSFVGFPVAAVADVAFKPLVIASGHQNVEGWLWNDITPDRLRQASLDIGNRY